MQGHARDRQGFTLLAALAILVLLSVFALAFAQLMSLERRAAASFVDGVRARLAARAGVERATVELQRIAALRHHSDPWGDGWGYRAVAPAGFDLAGRPLDLLTTTEPSFKTVDATRKMFGQDLSYSGLLGIDVSALLVYRLKVIDCPSQVNLNHPERAAAERMLRSLLRAALGMSAAQAGPLAAQTLSRRPPSGFGAKTDALTALTQAGLSADDLKKLQDLVGIDGWRDPDVIRPWNSEGVAWQQLDPMPRAPVNLNTATEPVLTALFAELKAKNDLGELELDYDSARRVAAALVLARGGPRAGGTSTPFRPFRTWREVEAFIDGLDPAVFATARWIPAGPINGIDRAPSGGLYQTVIATRKVGHRDLLKAMLNPNSMINKFGSAPNHGGWGGGGSGGALPRLVDKSDITAMTTEGCFDAMGSFEITSLGLILDADERAGTGTLPLAAATHQAIVEIYRPLRLSTQAQFEANRAFMVPGDFIKAPDQSWSSAFQALRGMNQPVFLDGPGMPIPGWPGVVSWPNYSLRRAGPQDAGLPMLAPHQPAVWDGSLTLTNLIGSKTANPDFNAGFARGRLEAIKGRAWFDPKDESPNGSFTRPQPPHPVNPAELDRLTRPRAPSLPRLGCANAPNDPSLIEEDLSSRGGTTTRGQSLFQGGSALWNTGVAISPDRVDGSGQPGFLTFDGDNLDLVRGASLRFWVQPLLDPFAREQEVLLSFVGSRDGTRRQAGFRVYKEALPTGVVNIVLEAVGGTENDESGLPVDWNWASSRGGASNRIEVEVTPAAPYRNDPLSPQWIPGTWHWIAINIGPGKLSFDGVTQYFATLQVDKRKASRPLFYKGNLDQPNGLHEYGELKGHVIGSSSPYEPLTPASVSSPNAQAWISPRLLGDFYHCDAGRGTTVITKRKTFGGAGNPAVVFQGASIPFYPWVSPGATPGQYVPGPAWPSPLPFPALSHNHRLNLVAYDQSGAVVSKIPMVRNSSGVWTIVLPADRSPWFGPDGPVARPAFTAPDGSVVGAQTVTGGYPGDAEHSIGVEAIWDETHYTRGCDVCNDEPFPADLTTLPSVEDDPYRPLFGETLPYSVHESGPTFKGGMQFSSSPITGFRSWVRTNGPMDHPQGREPNFPAGPPFGRFPITYLDDDCHGCERCDVDGPIFIGGEPGGDRNYAAGGVPAPVDRATMACAVFDNIAFVNGDEARRTDWPGSSRPNVSGAVDPVTGQPKDYSTPGKDFEDRYYEFNLAASLDKGSAVGHGAVYHRGLLELDHWRGRLGTVTWTSYPGSELDFEVGLWRLSRPAWRLNNAALLPDPDAPTWGFRGDGAVGIVFSGPNDPPVGVVGAAAFDAVETSGADLLVVGLRLRELGSARGSGQPIPAPLVETPVFEDLTITLIHERPLILHAQEAIEE